MSSKIMGVRRTGKFSQESGRASVKVEFMAEVAFEFGLEGGVGFEIKAAVWSRDYFR